MGAGRGSQNKTRGEPRPSFVCAKTKKEKGKSYGNGNWPEKPTNKL